VQQLHRQYTLHERRWAEHAATPAQQTAAVCHRAAQGAIYASNNKTGTKAILAAVAATAAAAHCFALLLCLPLVP
jgi:hypothetical protein